MSLLSSLLMAQALAGEPSLTEAPQPKPVDTQVKDPMTESVRAGLEDALPGILAKASRACGVDLVRYQVDGSTVLAVKVPPGKAECVDASLASHTLVFLDPDRDWTLKAACSVSAVPAPKSSRPFDFAQHKTATFHCTAPVVEQ